MKNHLILFLTTAMLLLAAGTNAQTNAGVKGLVLDHAGEAEAGAWVNVLQLDSVTIAGRNITDENGEFIIKPIPAGNYLLQIGTANADKIQRAQIQPGQVTDLVIQMGKPTRVVLGCPVSREPNPPFLKSFSGSTIKAEQIEAMPIQ